jgi:hypothetical protein
MIIERKSKNNILAKAEISLDYSKDIIRYFDKDTGICKTVVNPEKEQELTVLRYAPVISSICNR